MTTLLHAESSPLKHKTILIKFAGEGLDGHPGTKDQILPVFIEDWWDRISRKSWLMEQFAPLGAAYTKRIIDPNTDIPIDNEVLYAKIYDDAWGIGFLIHTSEIVDSNPDISSNPMSPVSLCTCYLGGGKDYRADCKAHGTLAPREKK